MQPDPQVYLWRAHQELRDALAAGAVSDPAAALAIDRVAELLAQLSLRVDVLPAQLTALEGRQAAVLEKGRSLLAAAGLVRPADPAPLGPGDGLEVRAYDRRARQVADVVHALAHAPAGDAGFQAGRAEVMTEARAIEADARTGWQAAAAAETKARAAARRDDEARPPPPTPEELAAFIDARVPGGKARVSNVRQQRGVNTKDIIFFDVDGVPGWPGSVVMRRLRGFNVNHLVSMAYEFGLLNTLCGAGVRTCRALAMDEGGALGEPLIMLEHLPGQAKKAEQLGADGRRIAEDLARNLGAIHSLDPAVTGRADLALKPHERVLAHIDGYYQLWRANHVEPSSLVESGFAWARDNAARLSEETVLVHGDYDLRNVLIDGDRISAVLDWERSHIGHPAEDLSYCRPDAAKFMPWDEFLAIYREAGGRPVTAEEIAYFDTWTQVFRMTSISRAHAGYARGEHGDFLLGSAGYIEFCKMSEALDRALKLATA